jgi:hypothetical protein
MTLKNLENRRRDAAKRGWKSNNFRARRIIRITLQDRCGNNLLKKIRRNLDDLENALHIRMYGSGVERVEDH